jgi:hypothetical protein
MTDQPSARHLPTPQELYDDIIREHGGIEAFSGIQLRLVHALIHATARPAETAPGVVAKLLEQLPPRVASTIGKLKLNLSDLTELSDAELVFLQELLERHPELLIPLDPESFEGKLVAEKREHNDLRDRYVELQQQVEFRDQRISKLEREIFHLKEEARARSMPDGGMMPHVTGHDAPLIEGEVIPTTQKGSISNHNGSNGSLEVTTSLHQRYGAMVDTRGIR